MSVCAYAACAGASFPSVALIGVGCGTLFMFLKSLLPETSCVGVTTDKELSEQAKVWLGLECDEKFVLQDTVAFGIMQAGNYLFSKTSTTCFRKNV